MSSTATVLGLGKESAPASVSIAHHPRHPVKIMTAAVLAVVGSYGIFNESQFVSSSDAVVSAYILNVRTPIDGTVTGLPETAGGFLKSSQVVAEVNNPLNDPMHLDTLRTVEERAQADADALASERYALVKQRDELLKRTGNYLNAVGSRLELQSSAAERTLASLKVNLKEAAIEYERGKELHSAGIMSNADFDKLSAVRDSLKEEVAAQEAALLSARSQSSSASQGILTEPGTNNDVAYSRQRADEINLRLAENQRMLIASRAQAEEAHIRVITEEVRSSDMAQTQLRAPTNGLLWRMEAVNGEQVRAGDSVLSLIDCSQQFLLVEVPQERLTDIEIGHTAFIRLTGEREERTGTIVSVSGDPQRNIEQKLAAFPSQDVNKELATVHISINLTAEEKSAATCAIGRTARVRIPTRPSNLASRWVRRVF